MEQEKAKGKTPDYTGQAEFVKDGIQMKVETAVWVKQDKNNKKYLSLNFGGINSALFKFELKPKENKPFEP